MCGFSGYINLNGNVKENILFSMNISLNHRGPDDKGIWINNNKTLGLTHNRLSVLDISSNGSQPMHSFSNRFVICFNGEIYNHLDIRNKLRSEKHFNEFKGTSDTETLIVCFEILGISKTLDLIEGMFAFALYDKLKNTLILVRDRFGEKPLYYGFNGNNFFFSSELKALRKHPEFSHRINLIALNQLLKYGYISSPNSIYEGINKLEQGTIATIRLNDNFNKIIYRKYWNLAEVVLEKINEPYLGSEDNLINEFENLLINSVEQKMISDVPIGAFLSGGIDSSLIVSLMQSVSESKINTFSIGFKEDYYDEAKYASNVAKHLNTNHTELYLSPNEIMNVIPDLPLIYDEPFADSSQLPTFLVSKLARENVTVCLSGDAGDEIFGGYNRYIQAVRFNNYPKFLKNILSKTMSKITKKNVEKIYNIINPLLPDTIKSSNPHMHFKKLISIFKLDSEWDVYENLITTGYSSNEYVIEYSDVLDKKKIFDYLPSSSNYLDRMMLTDSLTYLTDDILCKVDRAAMKNSLETRIPFLDRKLFEFAWSLPRKYKIKNGKGKWILRKLLNKYVPMNLVDRPKMGFGIPINDWLRGPLKNWAEELLNEKDIDDAGYLDSKKIRKIWKNHKLKNIDAEHELWNILMFQAWSKKWL